MNSTNKLHRLIFLAALFIWGCSGMGQKSESDADVVYYGIDIGGVQCGYFESERMLISDNDKKWLQIEEEIMLKLTVLGQDVDILIHNDYKVDPLTHKFFYGERNYTNGAIELISTTKIQPKTQHFATRYTQYELPQSPRLALGPVPSAPTNV